MTDAELERFYDAHASGLSQYLLSLTRSESDARDVLQEVFIKLARLKLGDVRNEKAWLWKIAHNQAMDWRRRKHTREFHERRSALECASLPVARFQAFEDPDLVALAECLNEALAALPDDQRSVLQLKLFEGQTFEEVAAVQGIPMNTAASRYRYALDKIRTLLRPIYEELKQDDR